MRSIFLCLIMIMVSKVLICQDAHYEIELSRPDEKGQLKIDVYNAEIDVTGYSGNLVKVSIIDNRKGSDKKNGGAEFYYQILENDNQVTIVNRNPSTAKVKGLKLELQIPDNFSINLNTYFGEKIEVESVHGDVEVTGFFTDITLRNLSQSVVVNTNKGKIVAEFDAVSKAKIIYISNYKGDSELWFPANISATLLLDNYFGKYQSDFKLGLDTKRVDKKSSNFIRRKINKGGAEIKVINYFGDINIRSK